MSSQSIPSLASLHAVGTLVREAREVGLYVLLHRVPELARKVALGALPDGLADDGVVGGDEQLGDRLLQLVHVLLVLLGRREHRAWESQGRVGTLHSFHFCKS